MAEPAEIVAFLARSLLRTTELVVAVLLLATVGFGVWLVATQPGSPDGGGVVVGLFLAIVVFGVLLAVLNVARVGVECYQFVSK